MRPSVSLHREGVGGRPGALLMAPAGQTFGRALPRALSAPFALAAAWQPQPAQARTTPTSGSGDP